MSVQTEIQELDAVRREIRVTVDPEETRETVKKVTREIARHAKLPGFRPGKAPIALVKAHYRDLLRREVVEKLVQKTYRPALDEAGVKPVHLGDIREIELPEDGPLTYTGYFEVAPEFELGSYKGVDVSRPSPGVTDEEVEARLEAFREAHGSLEETERETPEEGDYVLCDFIQSPLEEGEEPRVDTDVFLVAGDENQFDELNDALSGGRVGETVEFEVSYPENHPDARLAGRTVGYKVRLKKIHEKVLPELDDDFVREKAEMEGVEALRARIREDLEGYKAESAQRAVRDGILTKLLESHDFLAPPSLVREEAQNSLRSQVRDIMNRGMDPRRLSVDWEEEFQKHLILADRQIKAHFLLQKIGEAEEIRVSDEDMDAEIERIAERQKLTTEHVRKELSKSGNLSALKESLLRRRILDFLMENASITDEESA